MTYKTIVAVLSAAEDAGKVTDHALALARRTGGHVIGIHAEAPVIVTLIAPMEYPDPNAVLELQERASQQTRTVEQAFRSRCERFLCRRACGTNWFCNSVDLPRRGKGRRSSGSTAQGPVDGRQQSGRAGTGAGYRCGNVLEQVRTR